MKILLYVRPDRLDVAELARRHPGVDFVLAADAEAAARELPEAEVLVTWTSAYDAAFVATVKDKGKRLRWIHFTTSGIDGILKAGGFPPGVTVTNSAGLAAPMVAEHAFALMLALGHRLGATAEAAAAQEWRRDLKDGMRALYGRTLCIVGLGAIGQEAARRALGFGMKVIGVSRAYKADGLVDEVFPRARLNEALGRADVVLLATVATAETIGMIGAATFAAMKPGTMLINVARGDLVDEDALAAACREGHLFGAGIDVAKTEPLPASSPLWRLPNVVITPHIAGGGSDTSAVLLDIVDDNIRRYLAGTELARRLDWQAMTGA